MEQRLPAQKPATQEGLKVTRILPEMITRLPEIDMPVEGVGGYLIQGDINQSVFFVVDAGVFLQEHAHAAQWGVVLEGVFEISAGGKKQTYRKGDSYYIPADTPHSGYYHTDTVTFDVFDDKDKFVIKTSG